MPFCGGADCMTGHRWVSVHICCRRRRRYLFKNITAAFSVCVRESKWTLLGYASLVK